MRRRIGGTLSAWLQRRIGSSGASGRRASTHAYGEGSGPEPTAEWLGNAGIDLRLDEQLALLGELADPGYQELFQRLRADPRLGRGGASAGRDREETTGSALVRNAYFPSPDAELYAALIVRERPARVVEVGAGYSTLVARHAIEHAGLDCELHVIDPAPRVEVERVADRVERARVEESSLAGLLEGESEPPLESGALLFIDSSHVLKAGGDGPFLYCRLLPRLPSGVLVHIHDVYLPYDYPAVYRRWGYTEQYVLHALLAGGDRFRVVCGAYHLSRAHPAAVRTAFGDAVARGGRFEGASFWIRSR